ncbi:MAG: hypothetical protein ABJA81_02015, partial [Nocardioidaceae bacterium]
MPMRVAVTFACAQSGKPFRLGVHVIDLEVEMHPGCPIDRLEMDVRVALTWREAAKLGMPGPQPAEWPAESLAPELARSLSLVLRYVDQGIDPTHQCGLRRARKQPKRRRRSRWLAVSSGRPRTARRSSTR